MIRFPGRVPVVTPPPHIHPTVGPAGGPTAGPSSGGSVFGSSLGVSLAVHGAVVATLAFTFNPFAAPSDARGGQEVVAHLEAYEPQLAPEPVETLEPVAAPDDEEPLPFEELDLPNDPVEEWAPVDAAPAATPGTSLFETVVYPRLQPRTSPEAPVEAEVEPADVVPPETAPQQLALDSSPEPVHGACPPPAYPRIAERRGWTGTVVLLIDVAPDGTVTEVHIESSSGHTVLDDAAVRAVMEWRFAPALTAGAPAAATVRKPIRFGAR